MIKYFFPLLFFVLLSMTHPMFASQAHLTVQDVVRSIEAYEQQTGDMTTFAFEKGALNRILKEHLPQLQKDIEIASERNRATKEKNQAWDHVVKEIEQLIEKSKNQAAQSVSSPSIKQETTVPAPTPSLIKQEGQEVSQPTTNSTTQSSQVDTSKLKTGAPVVPSQTGTTAPSSISNGSNVPPPPPPPSLPVKKEVENVGNGTVSPSPQTPVTTDTIKQVRGNLKPVPVVAPKTPSSSGTVTTPTDWSKLSVKQRAELLSKQGFQPK